MFDVKRFRERAADWLGDVGSAALFVAGDILGAVGKAVRGEAADDAHERDIGALWVCKNPICRAPETSRVSAPCGCGAWLERESASPPESAAPRIEVRDGVEWLVAAPDECDGCAAEHEVGGPCCHHLNGEHLAVAYPNSDGDCEILARWPIEPAGTSPPAGQGPAPHPPGGEQPVDGGALWGVYADIFAERMAQDRKWGGPKHDDAHDVSEWVVFIQEKLDRAEEADDDAGYRRRMVQVAALAVAAVESLDRQRAPAVKPPHNAEPGALGEALAAVDAERRRLATHVATVPASLCAIAAEATRATDGAAPALAADIEEQRLSHGGCTRLPPEMLAALGAEDGDMVWFLRSQPGGRWEAWTSPELDEQLGMGEPGEAKAAVDAMPHHVASRLTAGEARRLEARGFVASVAWHDETSENMYGPWHERDADDLAHVRQKAADRATHPVASAAEMVPESPSGGAGDVERLIHRARAKLNVLAAIVDPRETPDGALGKPRHEIARRLILEAEQALDAALGIPVEPDDVEAHIAAQECAATTPATPKPWPWCERHGAPSPSVDCDACLGEATGGGAAVAPALPKPDAVRVGQRWRTPAGMDLLVRAVDQDGDAYLAGPGVRYERVSSPEMQEGIAWTYLGMVKPDRVEVGQRWRCVGVDGELVVRWIIGDGASARLGPAGDDDIDNTIARTADMLGLREWSYVGGAR